MDGVFVLVWVFGWWIRKAALSDMPVACRNRRGFSAEKRIHHFQDNRSFANGNTDCYISVRTGSQ